MFIPNSPSPPRGITCNLDVLISYWKVLSFSRRGAEGAEENLKTQCTSKMRPQIEMLTPKGEHSIPLFYQGDVRWENHFRRLRNRQKLGDWMIRFPDKPVKRKSP